MHDAESSGGKGMLILYEVGRNWLAWQCAVCMIDHRHSFMLNEGGE
jgi:hypothetical protein